jgi:transposase-like protein
MGLNLSNAQIAQELDLNKDDLQYMTEHLRNGIAEKKNAVTLSGVVEFDELYLVAGHKGQPDKVKQAKRPACRRRLKGARGRGTRANEKPPIFGMIQRSGEVVIKMLENVKQDTIKPLILKTVSQGTQIYTDEYAIYSRLQDWGFSHNTVNYSAGEYARDEDGDGFCEVHSNTIENVWSLLRPWLRPHRGIS